MDTYQDSLQKSKHYVRVCDHILSVTYPVVNEPKVLLSALENVFLAATKAMSALLLFERGFKRVPPFSNTFDGKYTVFQLKIIPQNKAFTQKDAAFIGYLKELIVFHKKSSMQFVREKQLIICDEKYTIRRLSVELIREYLQETQLFVKKVDEAIK
ncbi:MAG: hypothetical protein ACI8Y7_000734 [Candidatus Woesearchaeota archaeon]|jgi:hypothetical protein